MNNSYEISDSLKEKLDNAETMDDVVSVCAEEGIEVTKEQLEAAAASFDDELNEDDLDNVNGGVALFAIAVAVAITYYWYKTHKRR